jgi:UDPglucose 6-dehydrogenase
MCVGAVALFASCKNGNKGTNPDALVIMTEWKAYRSPNLTRLKELMKAPVVFDGRNLYEPATMRESGVAYFGIGRNSG